MLTASKWVAGNRLTRALPILGAAPVVATGFLQVAHAQAVVTLSGQINRAILYVDDGVEKQGFNVDNNNSSTRIRLTGEGPLGGGLKAGALFEVEYRSNATNVVTFASPSASPTLDERHLEVYFTGDFGMVRLGQGDGAANSATEVDLSGTTVAHYAQLDQIGGAFAYRDRAGALSNATIAGTITDQDFESRYDRLLYRTPSFAGFTAEASWGNKNTDIFEAALRYSAKLGGFGTLAAAVGYSNESGAGATIDDKTYGGSISWLHTSGFNLTYAHTTRELPGRKGKFDYGKVGFKAGLHAVSIDYGQGKDQAASGDKAKEVGIGASSRPPRGWICSPSTSGTAWTGPAWICRI